jgi:hypothetical protein
MLYYTKQVNTLDNDNAGLHIYANHLETLLAENIAQLQNQ